MGQTIYTTALKSILKKLNTAAGIETLTDAEDLFSAGVLDSLLLIQYVLAIEEEFNLRIPNEFITFENFQSFEKQKALLEQL